MRTDYHDWAFDNGRWTKIAAQDSSDHNPDPNELDEADNHGDDDNDEGPLWVIDVLADGTFTVFASHHSLTDREEPFHTFAEAVQFCEASDDKRLYGRSKKKPIVAPDLAVPVSGPGVTLSPYYSDDNCTIYNADCRDVLPLLGQLDLLLTVPPQYELGLSDENRARMDSGLSLAPQTNRISSLPAAELLLAISKADNAIVWNPSRYKLPDGKQLDWSCRKVCFATAWHNIAIPRMISWGEVPESDWIRVLIQCIQITPTANTILDPFMGTGDVLIAATRLRRKFVGIEADKHQCEQALNRLLERKKAR